MFQPENVEHVMDHIAQDLCVRYPEVPCERIEAIVATEYARLKAENHLSLIHISEPTRRS